MLVLKLFKMHAKSQQRLFAKMQDSKDQSLLTNFSKKVTQREDLMLQMDNM